MSDSDFEYDGAEAYIKERNMIRRFGKPFSTDIEDAVEYSKFEPLLMQVHNGGSQLLTTCLGYENTLEGQMGMVDFGDGEAVQAVTALHNVLKRRNSSPRDTLCTFSGRRYNETFAVEFHNFGIPVAKVQPLVLTIRDESILWDYGVDITRGTFPEPTPLSSVQNYHVFHAVPQGFEYTVGTKIAMAIFAKQAATVESARISSASKGVDLTHVYGQPDEVSIYTGMITAAGEKFFTHDVNSYRGCSGALIFLLDGQTAGMCVGVHIGSPADIEPAVNLAIKIRESPTLIKSPPRRTPT